MRLESSAMSESSMASILALSSISSGGVAALELAIFPIDFHDLCIHAAIKDAQGFGKYIS
jgi:hypothetical protein